MKNNPLGKNPLFQKSEPEQEPLFTDEEVAQIKQIDKRVYPYESDADEFVTMSFRIRQEYLKVIRDYAYTKRLSVKDALDEILSEPINNIDKSELLESPEKPKVARKKV